MTKSQIIRFIENEDATSVIFKQFNQSPDDRYPSFSVCLTGEILSWYNDHQIFSRFGLAPASYGNILKGENVFKYEYNYTTKVYKKIPAATEEVVNDDVEQFYLNSSQIWKDITYGSEYDMDKIDHSNDKVENLDNQSSFTIGFNTPDTICFSRKETNSSDRTYDSFSFDEAILNTGKYAEVQLRIFSHYPKQLLRAFHKPVFDSTIGLIREEIQNKSGLLIGITLSQVTVLKRRSNANIPCDKNLEDDDAQFQMEIMKTINCIPIYWKHVAVERLSLKLCHLASELQKANQMILAYKDVLLSYDSPCLEMSISTDVEMKKMHEKNDATVKFIYVDSQYQEISNDINFGLESFVSGVGGFIGIFVGYSMLQIPELFEWFVSVFRKYSTRRYQRRSSEDAD